MQNLIPAYNSKFHQQSPPREVVRDAIAFCCPPAVSRTPLAINMGGGYSERLADIVDAHVNTFRLAQEIWF